MVMKPRKYNVVYKGRVAVEKVFCPAVLDLSIGETGFFCLSNGAKKEITVLSMKEERDSLRSAIRRVIVGIDVSGAYEELEVGNYSLPKLINGVKIDIPASIGFGRGLKALTGSSVYGLDRDVRIRCWDPESSVLISNEFTYPVKQAWFVTGTQMGNEPCFVNNADIPGKGPVYYHYGLDIGGFDKAVPVVSAMGGIVVSKGDEILERENKHPVSPGYDVVYIKDERSWYYRYSHLYKIDEGLKLGDYVKAGAPIGILGKEGGSGGWSHLHFDIHAPQPSGKYGIFDGYVFLVEAYLREHPGALLACARPHRLVKTGEAVFFDGTKSICDMGEIINYTWQFSDGTKVCHPRAYKIYTKGGAYSEKLFVTDGKGRVDVDFCVVQVIPAENPANVLPTIHVTYYPAEGIHAGQRISFKARTFNVKGGEEAWDFGDGTKAVTRSSDDYDQTFHTYKSPGLYIVEVKRTSSSGFSATSHCKVLVK